MFYTYVSLKAIQTRTQQWAKEEREHEAACPQAGQNNDEVKGEEVKATWAKNPTRIKALCNSLHFTHNSFSWLVAKVLPNISSSADTI